VLLLRNVISAVKQHSRTDKSLALHGRHAAISQEPHGVVGGTVLQAVGLRSAPLEATAPRGTPGCDPASPQWARAASLAPRGKLNGEDGNAVLARPLHRSPSMCVTT
jgi:hypothetical protein